MNIIRDSEQLSLSLQQVAREICYSLIQQTDDSKGRANLIQALRILGVNRASDIGLSSSIDDRLWK